MRLALSTLTELSLHQHIWKPMLRSCTSRKEIMTAHRKPMMTSLSPSRRNMSEPCVFRLSPEKAPAKVRAMLDSTISPCAIYSTLARWSPSTQIYSSLLQTPSSHVLLDCSLDSAFHVLNNRTQTLQPQTIIVDSGASMCFCKTSHRCVQTWSIRPLDRPLRVRQSTTACICRQFGIALLLFEHAINASDGMAFPVPVFLVDNFHDSLFLVSTGVRRLARIQTIDPVDGEPFLFLVPENTFATPQRVANTLMAIRLHRENNLLTAKLRRFTEFDLNYSLLTTRLFSWDESLVALSQHIPPLKGNSVLKRPPTVSDTLPCRLDPPSTTHTIAVVSKYDYVHQAPMIRKSAHITSHASRIRTGIVCAGVVTERVFAQDSWFRSTFDVQLICERDTSRLELARSVFPNAVLVKDVRQLPAYLRSNPMNLYFIMASFPCVDETPLRSLNGYHDTETADLFRGDLAIRNHAVNKRSTLD